MPPFICTLRKPTAQLNAPGASGKLYLLGISQMELNMFMYNLGKFFQKRAKKRKSKKLGPLGKGLEEIGKQLMREGVEDIARGEKEKGIIKSLVG
jgi:hypothetical protein